MSVFKENTSPNKGDAVAISLGASIYMKESVIDGDDVYSYSTEQSMYLINNVFRNSGFVHGKSIPKNCSAAPTQCQGNGYPAYYVCADKPIQNE